MRLERFGELGTSLRAGAAGRFASPRNVWTFIGSAALTAAAIWALLAGERAIVGSADGIGADGPATALLQARLPKARPGDAVRPEAERAIPTAPVETIVAYSAPGSPAAYSAADREDLGLWTAFALPLEDAQLNDMAAISACEAKARNGLAVPSSLRREQASTGVFRTPSDNPVVFFDADTRNGFGFELAVRVHCVFEDSRLARLDVSPR